MTPPFCFYTDSMKQPLQPAHGGAFLINDTAANDPACQAAMASYLKRLQREEAQRQAIRDAFAAGDLATIAKWGRTSNWHISDRD